MMHTDFAKTAAALAEEIWERRVVLPNGEITWPHPEREDEQDSRSLGPHLYDGSLGIAFFLAALELTIGSGRYRERSLATLSALRRKLSSLLRDPGKAERLKRLGPGGLCGIGAFIYGFSKIGEWLDEPSLREEGRGLAALITPERIAQDQIRDVLLGSAGAVLVLLGLYRSSSSETQRRDILALAVACAEHLAEDRVSFRGLPLTWSTLPQFPPLTGFAHGAAGISYSLLRLFDVTGDEKWLRLAAEGYEFERALFSPNHGNWRDMRKPDEPRYQASWCYGAPGIALGRIGGLGAIDDPSVRDEIAVGLETTADLPLTQIDHVCCGNLGRSDILLYAAEKLGISDHQREAEDLAARALARAETAGWVFRLDNEGVFDPSLFTGASGIGYALLRLARPGLLPSVLALE